MTTRRFGLDPGDRVMLGAVMRLPDIGDDDQPARPLVRRAPVATVATQPRKLTATPAKKPLPPEAAGEIGKLLGECYAVASISPAEREIAAKCGLSDEQYAAHRAVYHAFLRKGQ
jgi:hypothetical protein